MKYSFVIKYEFVVTLFLYWLVIFYCVLTKCHLVIRLCVFKKLLVGGVNQCTIVLLPSLHSVLCLDFFNINISQYDMVILKLYENIFCMLRMNIYHH
jgi:hypothetical protein